MPSTISQKQASRRYRAKHRDIINSNRRVAYGKKKQKSLNKPVLVSRKLTEKFTDGRAICMYQSGNRKRIVYIKTEYDDDDDVDDGKRTIHNENAEFYQIPEEDVERVCMYICAPNQSGKTTYVARFLEKYTKIFPDIDIILFSKLRSDPILDVFNPHRIDVYEFELDKNTLDDLSNSLVIFDDVDQIHEKQARSNILNLINEILANGAHFNTGIIVTNHLLSDYRNTRTILNECSSITVFPQSGSAHHLDYLLKNYIGMTPDQIKNLKQLNSRWVTIFKNYPQTVLYLHGCYLL